MGRPASPIVCTLTPDEILARKASLLPGLAARASHREPTADGYRLRFDAAPDILPAITDAVNAERQCCRFLRFELVVAPDAGAITLTMSGPDGSREFLMALIDS